MVSKKLKGGGFAIDILNSDDYNFNYQQIGQVDEDGFLLFVHESLKDKVASQARNPILSKTFGLLLGTKIKTKNRYIVHINHIMPLGKLKPYKTPKALSDKKWESIQNQVFNTYPSQAIVGWYGVRKGWNAMLTEQDQRIHREIFTKSWHVIYLFDNANNASNFFYWDRDKIRLLKGHYEYREKDGDLLFEDIKTPKRSHVIAAISGILAVLSIAYLVNHFGKTSADASGNIGEYIEEASADEEQNTENELAHDQLSGDNLAQEESQEILEEYTKKITELERELEEKEKSIQALQQEIAKETSEDTDEMPFSQSTIYIVQRGDNLYKISSKFYNTEKYANTLAKINRIRDHRSLRIGSYLIIPSIEEIEEIQ